MKQERDHKKDLKLLYMEFVIYTRKILFIQDTEMYTSVSVDLLMKFIPNIKYIPNNYIYVPCEDFRRMKTCIFIYTRCWNLQAHVNSWLKCVSLLELCDDVGFLVNHMLILRFWGESYKQQTW